MLGTNEISQTTVALPDAAILSQHQTFWTAAKLSGSCVFAVPTKPAASQVNNTVRYAATMAVLKTGAVAAGCTVVDFGALFVDWPTANSLGFEDDPIPHETNIGAIREGRFLVDALLM